MANVNPIYKAPKTRKFGGKVYTLDEGFRNKSVAETQVKFNRKIRGLLARLVTQKDEYFPYLVYTRRK